MTGYLIQEAASYRLDEIYRYSQQAWGDEQAEKYIRGLFDSFEKIANQNLMPGQSLICEGIISRVIPAEFGVSGYFCRFEHHYIYWKRLASGQVGIVTILHEKMHQGARIKELYDLLS